MVFVSENCLIKNDRQRHWLSNAAVRFIVLWGAVQLSYLDIAKGCQLRPVAEVGSVIVYSEPTDDSERGDAGSISVIYRDGHEYDCTRVTPDGWVLINHGWRPDANSPRTYNSWAPATTFQGDIRLSDGRVLTQQSIYHHPGGAVTQTPQGQAPSTPGALPGETPIPRPQPRPDDLPTIGTSEDFISFFERIATRGENGRDGYRYELPMSAERNLAVPRSVQGMAQQGPCGGLHIRSQRTNPYMNPTTACLFAAVSQEWRQNHCPGNGPNCRIIYGDAGHDGSPTSWPHASHNDGQCIDLWPMRQNLRVIRSLDLSPTATPPSQFTINHPNYSSERTSQFTEVLARWGVEDSGSTRQFFFNDQALIDEHGYRSLSAHDDHMHVCFRNNEANRERCRQFRRDPNICHFNQPVPDAQNQQGPATDSDPDDSIQ